MKNEDLSNIEAKSTYNYKVKRKDGANFEI